MSNIDKQALREAAEKANPGPWHYHKSTTFMDAEISAENNTRVVNLLAGDVTADNSEFIAAASPATVLALLDELEAMQKYVKGRDAENEDLMLTVGRLRVEKEAAEKRIAELREWNLGLAQESFERQQRIAELQSVNDELKKFPDQIVSYIARLGTSEIGGHTKNVIYRAAQKVIDRAAGIGKGE